MKDTSSDITPELLLHAYSVGSFPMAEHRDDPEIFWVDPKRRGVLPLHRFHISRSLARRMRNTRIKATLNTCFEDVLSLCADRAETWINPEISALYTELHRRGKTHSVEIWYDGQLAGCPWSGLFWGKYVFAPNRWSKSCTCLLDKTPAGLRLSAF